ncbi:MAG: thioredoxin family protein [Candidatus Coatesbacteria bacterium]|nr:thioredoxin family protein [Candidatus Coatesbacteria bacterium]
MQVRIYGMGCSRCARLHQNVMVALERLDLQAAVIKVQDLNDIAAAGVTATPGLEIDGKLVSQGRLLTVAQLQEKLRGSAAENA